jgi:hypothetical protein
MRERISAISKRSNYLNPSQIIAIWANPLEWRLG